jgi:4a-hydroxytetrahydrobiopterin dehydratase
MDLTKKHCVPCEGGVPKLNSEQVNQYLDQVSGWEPAGDKIRKNFKFKDFVQAMAFVNKMAEIAEAEGHHPDFTVHYNQVEVVVWTHAIGGLSENDFILAAKIDQISK